MGPPSGVLSFWPSWINGHRLSIIFGRDDPINKVEGMKNDKEKNIHYFPGHMKKAQKEIAEYVKLVDLICEIADARAPASTQNPFLASIVNGKKRMILLSKADYADEKTTSSWVEEFKKKGIPSVSLDLTKDKVIEKIRKTSEPLFKQKREKEARLGMKPQPIRIMVIGVPNVGKSTFINSFRGKAKAKVANKAGYTRSEQWIKVNDDFLLLDTPGILPMNYGDEGTNVKLALLGCMKEEILPQMELAEYLFNFLHNYYPKSLNLFDIEDTGAVDFHECLEKIAKRRGLLVNGQPSFEKASYLLIKEFKEGRLGKISLESPNA